MERLQAKKGPGASKELRGYLRKLPQAKGMDTAEVTYSKVLDDKLLVAKAVRHGIPNQVFQEIKANSPFDDEQWSNVLGINIRTLQRYKKDPGHVFKPLQSEKIFELAEVVSMGNAVFDSSENFRIWLTTPSLALGGERPLDLLDSSYGKDLVLAELNSIEHGIFV